MSRHSLKELYNAFNTIKEHCESYGGHCRDLNKDDMPLCKLFDNCPYFNKKEYGKMPKNWDIPENWSWECNNREQLL